MKKTIYFVHDGKAAYPAVPAYEKFFSKDFICASGSLVDYQKKFNAEATILWYMMGFYPRKVAAFCHIHDYRSLSVGGFSVIKDYIKKRLNFVPDIRIFQNQRMRDALGFNDGVPECLIPVGIAPSISSVESVNSERLWDFAYVGAINRDRQFHQVIESFIRRFGDERSFALIGPAEDYIKKQFVDDANIIFLGKRSQQEAYQLLRRATVSVAYFPYHRPHTFQAPTKLLEYMALGVPILANDAPSNLEALHGAPTKAIIAGQDIFKNCPEPETFATNQAYVDPSLLWPAFIVDSGLPILLERFVRDAEAGAGSIR